MSHAAQPASADDCQAWDALAPACIVCLGNELARDDGVGMRLGRIMQALPLPAHVQIRFSPQIDLDLIDELLTAPRLILCDATRLGATPGKITVETWRFVADLSRKPYCCHGIGLADLVAIAAELGPIAPEREFYLVGVEAQTLDEFGTHLSELVQAALPLATQKILALLAAPATVLTHAGRVAHGACAQAMPRAALLSHGRRESDR